MDVGLFPGSDGTRFGVRVLQTPLFGSVYGPVRGDVEILLDLDPCHRRPPNSDDTADPEHGRTAPKKEEGESKKDDKLPSPVPSSKKRLRASSSV